MSWGIPFLLTMIMSPMYGLMPCSTTSQPWAIILTQRNAVRSSMHCGRPLFQVLGKDILTTHSVYWGTMLFALGLNPANHLFAHGWWTVEGQKMSKSIGNVVDPHLLIRAYGADAIRFSFCSERFRLVSMETFHLKHCKPATMQSLQTILATSHTVLCR